MATAGNGDSQIPLPGFNLSFDDYDSLSDHHFASALDRYTKFVMPLTTLREFTMMSLMNQLTDKPDWNIKVFDDNIANKWKNEALARAVEGIDISQGMVDWCIEELRYKAKAFEKTGMVTAYNGDVIKSDVAVSPSLRLALANAVMHLEEVPPFERDWHPGSDEKVLDLVHPSLFPLVSGLTRILPNATTTLGDCIERTGEGITLQFYTAKRGSRLDNMPNPFSEKFQWLPCEVDLSGDEPKITSYINNLQPRQHKDLYCIIEQIIGCAIPLWNESLTRQKTPGYRFLRVEYRFAVPEGDDEPNPKRESNQDEDEYHLGRWGEEEDYDREALQPKVKPFQPPNRDLFEEDGITLKSEHKVDLKRDYNRIQVIVKLANIHLTPAKPRYEGGTWHVEGQLNEHICASALLYYSSDNITPSYLAFRHMVNGGEYRSYPRRSDSIDYPQDYHRWLEDVFRCQNEGPAIQDIGNVFTKEGRLITFPNILQHQVQPFELADPTKPGHRKILALFLVDPNVNIISTANVPCQRKDWWRPAIKEQETLLGKLPLELKDNVYEMVEDFPISMEKAKEVRLELMDERKTFVIEQDDYFNETTFSLCEH